MLKQRVMTAVLLLPLVMVGLFTLPADILMPVLAIILLRGTWEYTHLAGLESLAACYGVIFLQAFIFGLLFGTRHLWAGHAMLPMTIFCAAWLLMFVRLALYSENDTPDRRYQVSSVLTAIVSISTGWAAIGWIFMQSQGPWLLLLLLLIVWAADTGAYFAGKSFGKSKLAPQISPGKTREGLVGGLIAAPLVALLAVALMPLEGFDAARFVPLCLITALVSVGGDLLISVHKRTTKLKDSGSLLPGHGGILDRLDSVIASAPFFALGLILIGR